MSETAMSNVCPKPRCKHARLHDCDHCHCDGCAECGGAGVWVDCRAAHCVEIEQHLRDVVKETIREKVA